ncbi:MAG: glycoside hydrolase family 3 C-terminal domain-containing protein, partial [Gorillibacterium sp.]|nr:glycoside hydrolase family 3 C-terminal domain-containing protein [Gorillibacterium sp.]
MRNEPNQELKKMPFREIGLPVDVRVRDLVSRLTLEEKISLMPTRQAAVAHLGIPAYRVGGEAAHGVAWIGEATVFPQPIGLACTWNPELIEKIGTAVGTEARVYHHRNPEKHGLTLWAPTVDMERDPRWGRTEEAYGEDPHLTGRMATAYVKGMQGDHPVYLRMAAALKHFIGNNNELDRLSCSSSLDPRNLREYYLKAFEPIITEGGARCIMTAYNSVNGTPAIESPLVREVVKGEWGLRGFVVCDGQDLSQTVNYHHYHETHAESAAGAVKSGVDCLTDDPELVQAAVRQALDEGMLNEVDLDEALTNVLRVRFELGQFDPAENNPYAQIPEAALCSKEHADLSLRAARESIVLLKNENSVLPLDRNKLHKVAVIGPLGDVLFRDWYSGSYPYTITPLAGIRSKLPDKEVVFREGCDRIAFQSRQNGRYVATTQGVERLLVADQTQPALAEAFDLTDWGWGNATLRSATDGHFVTTFDDGSLSVTAESAFGWFVKEQYNMAEQNDGSVELRSWNGQPIAVDQDGELRASAEGKAERFEKRVLADGLAEAVAAAREADVAIVFVGNNPVINGKEEIDREDITLPAAQDRLLRAVFAANPNTVVVITGSYPFALNGVAEQVPAILFMSHAGQEAGAAVADVLFGDCNPAGRLNMTWYRSVEQLPDIMEYDIIKGKRTYQYFDGDPLYAFGHGLSYTDFTYSGLSVHQPATGNEWEIIVSFDVTNTGSRTGDEVVQLYVRAEASRVVRPIKTLRAFQRLTLESGETRTVTFQLPVRELAMWDVIQG